ncbi:kinase-like protein [Aspergillus ibericus CBS 121593]|uniref:EKC/KEOPS complex subunit BUD32 n=1 Tax=Aspergillus ibericus CBS 121593 TaxID=1448316 RepID=A0A395H8G6_9EURO|nr:kinase-like protein [Aspergillus ibericus CBS 121593]RAL03960.1 kinase-like protein [Aspergillus ibericus CBS 121593]
MKPSEVKYEYTDPDEVERLDFYVPGGYHPVQIGDKFHNSRYVIIHKLGRLVALKTSTVEAAERTAHESQVLKRLEQAKSQLPGKAVSGPNGNHRCLVLDAARVNINEAKEAAYHRLLHLPAARAIVAQLVLGVQFLHSQGIVHGDLRLGNILLRLPPSLQHMTAQQLYDKTGEPAKEPVIHCDGAPLDHGVPSELVVPLWLGLGSDEITLTDSPILLADFGESFDPSVTKTFSCHTPHLLAPPEAFFAGPETDDNLSFPADIWTLACTIWDILGSAPPFEVFIPSLDSVTREHVETFGRLPDRWWGKWAQNVKEELRQLYGNSTRAWDQRFPAAIRDARRRASRTEETKFEIFGQAEERTFGDMIKSMLVLEPGQRAPIADVVRCDWMQK